MYTQIIISVFYQQIFFNVYLALCLQQRDLVIRLELKGIPFIIMNSISCILALIGFGYLHGWVTFSAPIFANKIRYRFDIKSYIKWQSISTWTHLWGGWNALISPFMKRHPGCSLQQNLLQRHDVLILLKKNKTIRPNII